MDSKIFKVSWILLLVVACFGIIIGLMALLLPDVFVVNEFQLFTGHQWSDFNSANSQVSSYISIMLFEIGFFALAVGISMFVITLFAYKKGEKWAWYYLLIVITLVFGGAIRANVYTGDMAIVMICVVFLVVAYLGLALGVKAILKKGST